ncbi:hypothetical protein TELCIR_20417 [Teladorsagia circumcincta]|uniref:Uncharacterized protein n=1 Tax=Teladorsagia circumcincta TaxID=45464 RepID=A0A2G9TJJ0_TELCI|nr:hypothetical protein TELCIR_20417 [Teladorsagia circumcincta]
MSLNAFISNSEDLEEQLSAEEFIKTLKKVCKIINYLSNPI